MKIKNFLLLALLVFSIHIDTMDAKNNESIDRIEPTNWFVGMKDKSLQIMVYGKNIKTSQVKVSYPGVRIDSVVRLDSPNYLLIYLNLGEAKAGKMKLNFYNYDKAYSVDYELKERTMPGEAHKGFDNSDVLYMLMPDRFANGNPKNDVVKGMADETCNRNEPSLRHGGDLKGIADHLDYFTDLGVTALWFTPVLENDMPADQGKFSSYHGYATTNYYKIDPRFGTNEEYSRLIAACHQRGLKVVMDMIFNHCGSNHPWNKDMPSNDWFNHPHYGMQTSYKLNPVLDPYASKIDLEETTDGWFVRTMPDLNQRNPHVIKYLIQNSEWWIETANIDGIRMDTYPYADRDAMAEWMKVLNTEYPNFNTVGETWVTDPAYTAAWQKDSKLSEKNSNLKTVMDFAFFDRINRTKGEQTDQWGHGFGAVYDGLSLDYLYPNPASVLAFVENHDTDRFLGKGKDSTALKQAYALLLTMKRIPQLYYGSEILMNGTKEITDGYVRKDFPGGWAGDKANKFTAAGRTAAENSMFDWTARLLHWRKGNDIIAKGTQIQFIPNGGVYVLVRKYNGRTAMTVLNGLRTDNQLNVKRYAEVIGQHTTAKNILTGEEVDLTKNIPLSQRDVMILEF